MVSRCNVAAKMAVEYGIGEGVDNRWMVLTGGGCARSMFVTYEGLITIAMPRSQCIGIEQ